MKFDNYLKYGIRELLKRPTAFTTSALVCFSGMLIVFNTLFMQYGVFLSDMRLAEERYHICLPDLEIEDIRRIDELTYVRSVQTEIRGDSLTCLIRLTDNDPYKLKQQCDRIIRETGIINKPAYRDNVYYTNYGPQDNWINKEYYDLATGSFLSKSFPVIMPFMLLTVACMMISMRIKVKNDISDYAAMRSYGYGIKRILRILRAQYSIIYHVSAVLSLILSVVIFKVISDTVSATYTSDFMLMDFAVPIVETVVTYVLTYIAFMLSIGVFRGILNGDVCPMLNGEKCRAARGGLSRERISEASVPKTSLYNRIYMKRSVRTVVSRMASKSLLLILPMVFVFVSVSVYGMRDQAKISDRDYGIHSGFGNYVTQELIGQVSALDTVERVVPLLDYGNGTYCDLEVYCVDGREEEAYADIKRITEENFLYFTDGYHNDMLIIKQSNTFTAFYMLQALILFAASLAISLADTRYALMRRNYEISVLRALGAHKQALLRLLCSQEITVSAAAFVIGGLAVGISLYLWVGIPYVRVIFIAAVAISFGVLYVGGHYLICRRHLGRVMSRSIAEGIRSIDI